jgi:hypothetical protein
VRAAEIGYPKMGSPPLADQNFIKTAGTVNPVSGKYWSPLAGTLVAAGCAVASGVPLTGVSLTTGETVAEVIVAVGDGVWP